MRGDNFEAGIWGGRGKIPTACPLRGNNPSRLIKGKGKVKTSRENLWGGGREGCGYMVGCRERRPKTVMPSPGCLVTKRTAAGENVLLPRGGLMRKVAEVGERESLFHLSFWKA